MKSTMNSRNIAKYHKMLEQDISQKKISEYLRITVDTLKKFTPEIVADHKKRVKVAIVKAAADKAAKDGTTIVQPIVKDPPKDPDSVSKEEVKEAVTKVAAKGK